MKELLKAKSEFRQMGVTLVADKQKTGAGGAWNFASEDKFIQTIQGPLSECGLELIVTMQYMPELDVNYISAKLFHVDSGDFIESCISMPTVTPKKDRNGNEMYLDAEIERGKNFGYWSRTLGIRILGLSDLDPESMEANKPAQLLKSFETWSKATGNQKKEYKVDFMNTCEIYGLMRDDIKDFFIFLEIDHKKESEVHNQVVHFLRQESLMADQIESYLLYVKKQGASS